jgi:hypothetical protein
MASPDVKIPTHGFVSLCYTHSRHYQEQAYRHPVGSPEWASAMSRAFYLGSAAGAAAGREYPEFDDGKRIPKAALTDPDALYAFVAHHYSPTDLGAVTPPSKTSRLVEILRSLLPRKSEQVLAGVGD